MHEAVRQGDAQGNSPDGTVEHAGVAMSAFFGELDAGEFVDAAVKDEKVRIADFGTSAASGTLLPVDQRRHRKTPLWNVLHISQYDNCSLRMIRF